MNPIKLPLMNEEEVNKLIKTQFICRIAFAGKEGPYIAPFQYVWINNQLYFHFTNYGNKIAFLKEQKQVCVEIEKFTPNLSEYAFIVLEGTLKLVEDKEERSKAIQKLSEIGKEKLSPNFLLAHGFNSNEGWSILNTEQPIMIIKLDKVKSKKGLKSS